MSPRSPRSPVTAASTPGTQVQPSPGPKNARTDEESGVRRYTWQGVEYPSVTSLRRIVGIPFTLHNWILNQHLEASLEVVPAQDGALKEDVFKAIRKAGNLKRDTAADLGIRVHANTAAGMTPDMAPPDERPLLYQYQDWLATSGFRIAYSERQVFNLTLGYGGSFDILGHDPLRRCGLLDVKTGKGVYLDHLLQLLGYTFAEFVGEDDVIDNEATDTLETVSFIGLVHLQPDSWEYIELAVDDRARRAFTAMCRLAHFLDTDGLAPYITTIRRGGVVVPPLEGAAATDVSQSSDPR